MVSLSVGTSTYHVAFSSIAERDAFARRARKAHLRIDWDDQMHCALRASNASSVFRLFAQDGGMVVQVIESIDDAAAHGCSDDSVRPKHGTQLTLW